MSADAIDAIVGKRISAARHAAGLTLRDLAQQLGWPHTTLGNYESGRRSVSVARLVTIAGALGCAPATLLTESPEAAAIIQAISQHPERAVQIQLVLDMLDAEVPPTG